MTDLSSTCSSPEAGPSKITESTAPAEITPAFEKWRSALSQFTGLGLNDEEKSERDRRKADLTLERDWNQCEKWKASIMTRSPMVVFMLKHLRLSGCEFDSSSIQCHPCPTDIWGGFSPEHGILLCQNKFYSKKMMEDTVAHELIHAFDHCRFNVNWENLRHHACSEIRAANLSGDCRWSREIQRHFYSFNKQHQVCVKRRAVTSVLSNPACPSMEAAERAVNEVWDSCFKDTRPFDEIY